MVEEGGRLVAAAPLYVKSHSYGEYVFDHGWAEGYRRAGGSYYPKLLAAVPFTPVPGPRLLAESEQARAAADREPGGGRRASSACPRCTSPSARPTRRQALARGRASSSAAASSSTGRTRAIATFEAWLDALKSAKRKMVRKEREQVARRRRDHRGRAWRCASTPALLDEFFPFYLATVDKRWGNAYLSRDFFRRLAAATCATASC